MGRGLGDPDEAVPVFRNATFRRDLDRDLTRAVVEEINADPGVDGLLVQLPVPDPIDAADVREWIAPEKDVDGLHPDNVGRLASGTPRFVPCTTTPSRPPAAAPMSPQSISRPSWWQWRKNAARRSI